MRTSHSSVGQELLWLGIFFAVFAIVTTIFLRYAAGHHYNDRIAITVSAILSALAMIGLRAWFMKSRARAA